MTIKDVEKLTGLTAKSIRYYESKNLISIRRNEENSYRNYTEEDVTRLRWIKMFRYLGFMLSGKLNDVPFGRLFRADLGFLQMCQSL